MRKRRKDYGGCAAEPRGREFRLRFRIGLPDGRVRRVSRPTGLTVVPENFVRAAGLAAAVTGCLKAGRTLAEIDAVLAQLVVTPASVGIVAMPAVVTIRTRYPDWLREQAPLIRPALARDYTRHFKYILALPIADIPLSELRAKDVRGMQAELLTRKHVHTKAPLSVKTVKNVIAGTFRAFIRAAVADELVIRDLFANLTWPAWRHPDPDPLTVAEARKVLEWLRAKRYGFPPLPGSMGIRRLPHAAFHAYAHVLLWAGLRPSEASGLQWQDIDLVRGRLYVRRSYHLYSYNEPKTASARRTVELLPETVRVLRELQPLHVAPTTPVFTSTAGEPLEPKTFSEHWYKALRGVGIRVRGLYCTKDTYVSVALQTVRDPLWVEKQTGVAYATLKKHYARWMPDSARAELRRLEAVFTAPEADVDPEDADLDPRGEKSEGDPMRGGGLEPPRVLPH